MIIVSAAEFEVAPLRAQMMDNENHTWVHCGIGVLSAAAAGQRDSALCRGREVLFIGTCGKFSEFNGIELCRAKTLHWSPTCVRAGLSYAVADTPTLSCKFSERYDDLPTAEVFCAPNVSLTSTLPTDVPRGSLCVENIELYAFLSSLGTGTKTVDVLLAITNAVGKDAHQQWLQHHKQAAQLTADYILSR